MSDDIGSQACKSILSPHVAEFVPSASTKQLNQDDVKYPDLSEKTVGKSQGFFQETREEKQPINSENFGELRKPFSQNVNNEKHPISSWRHRNFEDNKFSKNPTNHKDSLNNPDRNWTYRDSEGTKPYLKDSRLQSKSGFTRHQGVDKPRRAVSFQSSVRSSIDQCQNDQPIAVHKAFGRGRGRARNAWTDVYDSKGKDFETLRSSDNEQGSTPGYGPGRGVSYSDKLKGTNSKTKDDFQIIKQVNDNHQMKLIGNKEEINPHRDGGIKKEGSDKEWTRVNKKKAQNESQNTNYKEHGMKSKERKQRIKEEERNAFENKEMADKKGWKVKRESTPRDMKASHTETPEMSAISKVLNNPLKPKITNSKKSERDFVPLKPADSSTNPKKIKLLRKDEEIPVKDDHFELLQNENEFPDLQSTSLKSNDLPSLASDWLSGGSRMPIISYSAALKTIPKPQPRQSNKPSTSENDKDLVTEGGDGVSKGKKKKKKKKKKKNKDHEKPDQPTPQAPLQQSTKKTKQPMQLDLGDWISVLDKPPPKVKADKQVSKKVTIATGVLQIKLQGALDIAQKPTQPSNTKPTSANKKMFHNMLDSTAPLVKRGKERETPKKKKPSPLKKIILKEREEKKKELESGHQDNITVEENTKDKKTYSKEEEPVCQSDQQKAIVSPSANPDIKDTSLNNAPTEEDIKAQIHSRRFREYCDNVMDKELNNTTTELLQKLVIFQDRQYHKDPIKSKAKRRYVVGLREVTKHLKLKKIKLVIISPNVERIKSAGGLDDTLHNIITIAHQNGVPVVFALRRQILGRILHKKVPVSAVGVFNYDGAQDHFKDLMDLTEKARAVYSERWKKAYDELMERIQKEKELQETLEEHQETIDQHEDIQGDSSTSSGDDDSEHDNTTANNNYHNSVESPGSGDELVTSDKGNAPCVETDMDVEDL